MSSRFFLKEVRSDDSDNTPEFSKERAEKIVKNYTKYVEHAIELKDPVSITALFQEHPFYSNLKIESFSTSTVATYKIYILKQNVWKEYHTAVFDLTKKDVKIYEAIGTNIGKLFRSEQDNENDTRTKPVDIFQFE